MSNLTRIVAALLVALVVTAVAATVTAAAQPDTASTDARVAVAERAGLRVLQSRRLTLVTDRPPRAGDGVDELPAIFDQAFDAWCRHYGMATTSAPDWRAFGCLVVDRERFRAAGLLPESVPDFVNGFCAADSFWLQDQSNPAYRRHLLLHEGVHAFTLTLRKLATPTWYNEGIAEYLATHRLEATAEGPQLTATPMPARVTDVEQLGRIEEIRSLRTAGRMASLGAMLDAPPGDHRSIRDYATNWAAVVLFAGHPRYAASFAAIERGPLAADFNERLAAMPGYDASLAAREFDAFTDDIDYGYDFARSSIDWSRGPPLTAPMRIAVQAGQGWQNAGVSLVAGSRYEIRATGRCSLGRLEDTPITTEADGISLDWYRGRPLGRLLAAQWVEAPADGGRPRFLVIGEGRSTTVTPPADGPVFLKLNEPPGELADDSGSLTVEIEPLR